LKPYFYGLKDHPQCDDVDATFTNDLYFDGRAANGSSFPLHPDTDQYHRFKTLLNNTVIAFYHAIRLDLGIVRPNQIYSSPARFNETIIDTISSNGYNFLL
jgi:hypothetical protein